MIPCPKCHREARPSGEFTLFDGKTAIIYKCDSCEREMTLNGQQLHAPVTFTLDRNGDYVDLIA